VGFFFSRQVGSPPMAFNLRPPPCETVDGLRPPLCGFPYFAGAGDFAFQPEATGCSQANAWWLADASFLVYGDAAFVEETIRNSPLSDQGFHLDWLGTPDNNRGMILASDTALVVVFRGTRLQVHSVLDAAEVVLIHQDDFLIDGSFLFKPAHTGGRVHAGFLSAFNEIRDGFDAIVAARQPGQRLWLTGHSLGGALATLAAAHVGPAALHGLYTYGAPRVGDSAFAAVLPQRSYHRFVHRDDWVVNVPPTVLGYVHGGTPQFVSGSQPRGLRGEWASGLKAFRDTLLSTARNLRFNTGDLPFQIGGLADHSPIYYATLLWNALADRPASPPPGANSG
jgi:triacylglycerol lipase